ncbi:hypothetical protein OG203_26535 [Nocardia sp. NBC_01499]|uniref:hypothetical protein n=1 Tax=Nocardia sp. NBC_01499 TaxID=2903597 RepID=UPI0038654D16
MRKISAVLGTFVTTSIAAVALAGPAFAIDNDVAMCAEKSAKYSDFQKCVKVAAQKQQGQGSNTQGQSHAGQGQSTVQQGTGQGQQATQSQQGAQSQKGQTTQNGASAGAQD